MSKVFYKLFVPVLLTLLCPACITEVDVGACNNTVISFENLVDGNDEFKDNIETVTYVIYDSEGKIVYQKTLSADELDDFQGLKVRLPEAGHYRVVAWGNYDSSNSQIGPTGKPGENQIVINGNDPSSFDNLYLGTLDFDLPSVDGRHEWTLDMKPQVVEIDAVIKSELPDADQVYEIKVGPLPNGITSGGEIIGDDDTYYTGSFTVGEDGKIESTVKLPPFEENTDAVIQIINKETGEVVSEIKLSDYLKENGLPGGGDDDNKKPVIDIEISVSGTDVSITFPGWKPKPVYPSI